MGDMLLPGVLELDEREYFRDVVTIQDVVLQGTQEGQ
jgi:hypothetical protein